MVETAADLVEIAGAPPPDKAEILWSAGRKGRRTRVLWAPDGRAGKARATVLVCPGRTEFIEKYFEVARELQQRGFAVIVIDWPGQGLSGRFLKDPLIGHVRQYGVYLTALVAAVKAVGDRARQPLVVLAHSMGGTIALEAMRLKLIAPRAAAFTAPMWGLPVPFWLRWGARLLRFFGQGARPAQARGEAETFESTPVTSDETRWTRDLTLADPRLALHEPSVAWVVSSFNAINELAEPGALAHLARTPMLIVSAGDERLVSNRAIKRIGRRLKGARLLHIEDARHEILMERDPIRARFWEAFDELCKKAGV
jgi:lysophospholipase